MCLCAGIQKQLSWRGLVCHQRGRWSRWRRCGRCKTDVANSYRWSVFFIRRVKYDRDLILPAVASACFRAVVCRGWHASTNSCLGWETFQIKVPRPSRVPPPSPAPPQLPLEGAISKCMRARSSCWRPHSHVIDLDVANISLAIALTVRGVRVWSRQDNNGYKKNTNTHQ